MGQEYGGGANQPSGRKDGDPVIDALLTEYSNIHERVFRQVELYEQTNVKIMMLVGVLLLFGISNYAAESSYTALYVDCVFFIALPVISICSVLLGVADLVKVMILGDYLKIIENKVDAVLAPQVTTYGFRKNRVMDWEWWRRHDGHVREGAGALSEISFSVIIVGLVVVISFFSAVVRLLYINGSLWFVSGTDGRARAFLIVFYGMATIFVAVLIYSWSIVKSKRKSTMKNTETDDVCWSFSKEGKGANHAETESAETGPAANGPAE